MQQLQQKEKILKNKTDQEKKTIFSDARPVRQSFWSLFSKYGHAKSDLKKWLFESSLLGYYLWLSLSATPPLSWLRLGLIVSMIRGRSNNGAAT